jgi:hypothetical protein
VTRPASSAAARLETDWSDRPRPARTRDNADFWAGMATGELRLQHCRACGALQHPPEPLCMTCGGSELDWSVAAGGGEIFSFVVYHEPRLPGFAYPYVVAVVTLDEGPRLIANIVDCDPGEPRIGDRVRATFRTVDTEFGLVAFVPEPR